MKRPVVYLRYLRRDWNRNGWEPTDTGWLLTIAIIVLVLGIALPERCSGTSCSSKWTDFFALSPSEMGDTLAGLFSGLAFIWIIVTVFLQSKELREQRKEFREQRLATQDMATAMKAQAEIFLEEQRDRAEARVRRVLERKLEIIKMEIGQLAERHYSVAWLLNLTPLYRDKHGYRMGHETSDKDVYSAFDWRTSVDEAFKLMAKKSRTKRNELAKFIGPRQQANEFPKVMLECFEKIDEILVLKGSLSKEDQIYLSFLELEETQKNWRETLSLYGVQL